MEGAEVGVNVEIEAEVLGSWAIDGPFVSSSNKVANNCFHCLSMGLFGVIAEAGDLTDSECDVWTGVARKVQEHANNG